MPTGGLTFGCGLVRGGFTFGNGLVTGGLTFGSGLVTGGVVGLGSAFGAGFTLYRLVTS